MSYWAGHRFPAQGLGVVTVGVVATAVTTSATADCGGAAASGELGWALVLSDTAAVLGAVASAVVAL